MPVVPLADIQRAAERIRSSVVRTPLEASASLSRLVSVPVHLKMEHRQRTGAFKLRGAANAVLSLPPGTRGVVAASTGNHGRALAHAAREAGLACTICLSHLVPANKVAAVEALGARVHVHGASQDDAQREADRLERDEGLVAVPPFDHAAIVAGQGTIGLEIVEDLPDVTAVLVPLSGGGLIAGVAAAVKALAPDVRIVGVSMERGAAMAASLRAGHPVEVAELTTLADSLGGGIGLANRWTFDAVRELVDEVVLLTEAEISAGVRYIYQEEHEVVEGAAAVGVSALLSGRFRPRGATVALLSGRNIDPALHLRILNGADALEVGA
ncbi:hydroxyectoine utilization dehydratase EutB [Aureimonas endophytica]|uniref:Hydroxyectoine utilization dehydratase EutB n=1 Tax=Aureimonas endophytica TaxID=2027858 RepID=A0A916ZLC7_9HYPH|nr:hydroxyectoine utilization dehydratase EutB [Aureimonas endophytica]GGE03114.1 hydroxyectoine utilization dehydratase EutB [Aureimonas endophytica]